MQISLRLTAGNCREGQYVSSGPGEPSLGQETQRLWTGEPGVGWWGALSFAGRGVCTPPAVERGQSSVGVSNSHQLTRTLRVHLRRMETFRKLTDDTCAQHVSQGEDIPKERTFPRRELIQGMSCRSWGSAFRAATDGLSVCLYISLCRLLFLLYIGP